MKGHIRKRGKTSWAIVLDLGRDADGKRRQKWHSVRGSYRDAERELARLVHEMNTGAYVEPSRLKLSEYLDRWMADYAAHNVAPKTRERYREMIDGHIAPAIGNYALSKLKPLHIQGFYGKALTSGRKDRKGGLSPQTVLHFHRLLHKALDQAIKWQLLANNPCDAVEPPRPERREMRALDEKETSKLLQLVHGSRLYIPVALAVMTGLRRGEILGLRWSDIDLKAMSLTVNQALEQTKTGLRFKTPKTHRSRRSIALPQMLVDLLTAHKAEQAKIRLALGPAYIDQGLVCPRDDGAPWPPDMLSTAFSARIRRAKISHVRFHDLRHTHATHLLRQGVHPKIVSERLGHSQVGITLDTYSHVLPGTQDEMVRSLGGMWNRLVAREDEGRKA